MGIDTPHNESCPNCCDEMWVCENHDDKAWDGVTSESGWCKCGAGMPCPLCNGDPDRVMMRPMKLVLAAL